MGKVSLVTDSFLWRACSAEMTSSLLPRIKWVRDSSRLRSTFRRNITQGRGGRNQHYERGYWYDGPVKQRILT